MKEKAQRGKGYNSYTYLCLSTIIDPRLYIKYPDLYIKTRENLFRELWHA